MVAGMSTCRWWSADYGRRTISWGFYRPGQWESGGCPLTSLGSRMDEYDSARLGRGLGTVLSKDATTEMRGVVQSGGMGREVIFILTRKVNLHPSTRSDKPLPRGGSLTPSHCPFVCPPTQAFHSSGMGTACIIHQELIYKTLIHPLDVLLALHRPQLFPQITVLRLQRVQLYTSAQTLSPREYLSTHLI
jgi:hypothetical protein